MAHVGHELVFEKSSALCNFFFFLSQFYLLSYLQVTKFVNDLLLEDVFLMLFK